MEAIWHWEEAVPHRPLPTVAATLGVRRPPSPRTRPPRTASPERARDVDASRSPCAKPPKNPPGPAEPIADLPVPPPGLTPIAARQVPIAHVRKESRPLAQDHDGSQEPLEPRKAKPRGPSEPSATRDPSTSANTPPMQGKTTSVCGLMWRALQAGHHFGKNVKPRPYMSLRDSNHLTTHCQQLRAYRTYEELLNGLPHQLQDADALIKIADTLLHLPETFPASYLKVYDPIIAQCLRLSGALQHVDLANMLACSVPQLDKARLSESLVGYGFLTTAQYIADLFFAVADMPSVINASFPAMMCYSDPDYWLGALLLAFESHQKGPLEPIVVGFPESDHRITDLQVNVPPAAMVAFLAGRAYRMRTCPTTKYTVDPSSGLPQVSGQVSQEALQAWAAAAKHTDMEAARLAQQPSLNAFLGISLQGSQTLGQRQYQEFKPELPPAHFLEAIRLALAASVANQDIEHFWSVYNLEWPAPLLGWLFSFGVCCPWNAYLPRPVSKPRV